MPETRLPPVAPSIRQHARELRHELTPAERKLWHVLRNRNLAGYKFRRQHPIGRFIVDFYCAEKRLIIEFDGDTHACQEEYDRERTDWFECQDLTVVRYNNWQVLHQLDQVLQDIHARIENGS